MSCPLDLRHVMLIIAFFSMVFDEILKKFQKWSTVAVGLMNIKRVVTKNGEWYIETKGST